MGCPPSPLPPVRPPAGRGAGLPGWCCCDPTSPAKPQAGVGLVRPTYLPRLLMRELPRILHELYRLEAHHFLHMFRISGALDRNVGSGAFDFAQVVWGELDRNRCDIFIQARQLRRARDQINPGFCASSQASAI
jgi:hypothetical protein